MSDTPIDLKVENYDLRDSEIFLKEHYACFNRLGLKIFHLNVRSCSSIKKFDDVKEFLRKVDPESGIDIIVLGETWFKEREER